MSATAVGAQIYGCESMYKKTHTHVRIGDLRNSYTKDGNACRFAMDMNLEANLHFYLAEFVLS